MTSIDKARLSDDASGRDRSTSAPALLPRFGARHRVFAVIAAINFVVWLDEGVFGALTPRWANGLGLSAAEVASVSSAYLLGYFPMLLVAGVLADRFGARRMLMICLVGTGAMSLAMLWITSYEQLFWRNLLFGIFFGFVWAPSNKMIANWLPGPERAKYTAAWTSFMLLSLLISVPTGLFLADLVGWRSAFLVVTLLAIPALVALVALTRETPAQLPSVSAAELAHIGDDGAVGGSARLRWADVRDGLSSRGVRWMLIAAAVTTPPTWLIVTWGTYDLVNGYRSDSGSASLMIGLASLIPVVYGFVHGRVVERVFGGRLKATIIAGSLLCGTAFLIASLPSSPPLLRVVLLYGIGYMAQPIFWGTVNAYFTQITSPKLAGTLSGLAAAIQTAAGFALVNASGNWVDTNASSGAVVGPVWLAGGIVFVLSVIPVLFTKDVVVRGQVATG